MIPRKKVCYDFIQNIAREKLFIHDSIDAGDPDYWIPFPALEILQNEGLQNMSLSGLPLRTRSKRVKLRICEILGYQIPSSFKKTKPRFWGQQFDTYIQKSNNLQVWNEELSPTRRYVLIQVTDTDIIKKVKVVSGEVLARLDTTGTLTQKYQACLIPSKKTAELISKKDTARLQSLVATSADLDLTSYSPVDIPQKGKILAISSIFEKLQSLINKTLNDSGYDQERNRGAELHRLICRILGYSNYKDDGQFPDVRHQLLEVKLQTSPTIDLGLVCPNSKTPLNMPRLEGKQLCHCDVRYVLFYGKTDGKHVTLKNLYVVSGEDFFRRFQQFQGKVLNKKLQIPLPKDFFD